MIASFLNPMLRLHPDKRAKAHELVHHKWLEGIVVQGEVDLIRRAEEEELLRREAERQSNGSGSALSLGAPTMQTTASIGSVGRMRLAHAEERHQREEQQDADALKPVGDIGDSTDAVVPDEVSMDTRPAGVMTSSIAQKENALRSPTTQQQLGHRQQGSRGNVRIDTGGPVLQTPTKGGKK